MRHEDAIKTKAAAGYLSDDLTESERDAFEEHFADCEACFDDVRAGARFNSTLREIAYEEPVPVPVPRPTFKLAFAAAASVVLSIGGLAYQQITVVAPLRAQLAKARQPRITPPPYQLREVREAEQVITIEDRHSPFSVEFVVTPDIDAPPYTCKIVDAKGAAPYTVPIAAEQAREPVNLDIPSDALAPGNYTLIVSGTRGVPVLEKRFTVR